MVGSTLVADKSGASSLQRTRSCPRCGSHLFFWEDKDLEWWCAGCNSRFDGRLRLLTKGEASSSPEQPAEVIPQEVKPEPSPRVPMTHPEGDNAKALTPLTPASKRRGEESPARPIYRFSVDGFWVSPGRIKFRKWEMLFLIEHLSELRKGVYPSNPEGSSGYTEAPVSKGKRHRYTRAYFEIPTSLAGEVSARLLSCGLAGLLLEAHHGWGLSEESLAKYTGLSVEAVGRKVSQALNYVSGFRRKNYSFAEFVNHRRNGVLFGGG